MKLADKLVMLTFGAVCFGTLLLGAAPRERRQMETNAAAMVGMYDDAANSNADAPNSNDNGIHPDAADSGYFNVGSLKIPDGSVGAMAYVGSDGGLPAAVDMSTYANWTACAWVFQRQPAATQIIVDNIGLTNNGWQLRYTGTGTNLGFRIGNGITQGSCSESASHTGINNAWHFVCGTWIGAGSDCTNNCTGADGGPGTYKTNMFYDGLATSLNCSAGAWTLLTNVPQSIAPLAVGRNSESAGTTGWNGLVDQVSLWNVAKNPSEIAALYNSGTPFDLTGQTGLVAYWPLGEGADTTSTLVDLTAGANNLAGTGAITLSATVPP